MAKKETALVDVANATKTEIQMLASKQIADLTKQLESLKKQVNKDINIDINYNGVNISKLTDVQSILATSAGVMSYFAQIEREVTRYTENEGVLVGATLAETVITGKNKEEWFKIFEKAIFLLRNKTEIAAHEEAITRLSKFVSEDDKLRNEWAEISKKFAILK